MDIPWMQLTGVKNVLLTGNGHNDISQSEQEDLLSRNLTSLNLSRDPVAGDGDCAFASIIKQLRKSNELQTETTLKKYLTDLGLGGSFDEDVHFLRQIFVNAVQSSEDYQQMLGVDQQEMNYETERFRDEGTYCGEMGDLIMKVCSDVLKIPILVVTNLPGLPYIPFVPEQQIVTEMLCMSFNAYGPGHYDATSLLNNDEENANEAASNGQRKTCSCGRNKKGQSVSSCIPFDTDTDAARAGRKCPCVMEGLSCCNSCRCRGCQNKDEISTDTEKAQMSCRCGESAEYKESKEYIACNNTTRKTKCPCFKNKKPCGEHCYCKNCKKCVWRMH
ncbi:uncharacterized protein LOC116295864 [Actinia tenebrosa]|uniref:Uncharacterized protein LOC116295864 n=1 Tax=Actinia tenebrosa TaxID=6105 RepID=A0A6P8HWF1_ACTTE|nr:uncharacterized protein LOC116295864 [Actinia tenebrosa]